MHRVASACAGNNALVRRRIIRQTCRFFADEIEKQPPVKKGGMVRWFGALLIAYPGAPLTLYLLPDSMKQQLPSVLRLDAVPPFTSEQMQSVFGAKTTAIKSMLPSPVTEKSSQQQIMSLPSKKVDAPKQTPIEAATATARTEMEVDRKVADDIKLLDKNNETANVAFEERLRETILSCETKLNYAMQTKELLAESILKHANLLKAAIDETKEPNWDIVSAESTTLSKRHNAEQQAHTDAQNYIATLRKVLNDARASKATASNPIVANGQETMNTFIYQLENATNKIHRAETESRIMTEYRRMIELSRTQFAEELKAVLPHAQLNSTDHLSEHDLNALIAHAHVKIDLLRRHLTEQQVREEHHIADAIARQRAEDTRLYDEQLRIDIEKMQSHQNAESERRLLEAKAQFEDELRNQLRRSAAAHSQHLEDVLRVQKEQLNAEAEQAVRTAVSREREEFHNVMTTSLTRLQTIEDALDSRAAYDAENRRAKELWLACQNLVEAIVNGRRGGKTDVQRCQPLANQMMGIRESSRDDPVVLELFDSFHDKAMHRGVYTEADLRARFDKVVRLCARTALIDGDNGGTVGSYALSFLQSLFVVRASGDATRIYSVDEQIDTLNPPNTFAILDRAVYHLTKRDDMTTAIKLLNLLRGEPARIARDWIRDARMHVETRQTAELLLAHSAAQSMRTVY